MSYGVGRMIFVRLSDAPNLQKFVDGACGFSSKGYKTS